MFALNKTTMIILFTFLYFLVLNFLSPPQGDDYNYILSNRDSLKNSLDVFFNWNSRLGELLFASFFSQIPDYLFNFLNAIVACVFVFLLFYILFLRFPNNFIDFSIILFILLLFLLLLSFEEVFLWGAGSMNYLWGFTFGALLLIPYRKSLQGFRFENKIIFCVFMFLLGLVVGVWHEGTSALILSSLILYCFYMKCILKKSIPLCFILGILGVFVGFLYLFFSPGQNARILAESTKYDYLSIGEFLSLGLFGIISRLYIVLKNAFNQNPIFFPILFFIIAFIYAFKNQIKNRILGFLVLILSFVLFLIILLEFPVFAYLMIFAMFIWIYLKVGEMKFLICAILLFFYFLSLLSTFQLLNLPFRSRALGVILLVAIIVILNKEYLQNKKIAYFVTAISISYFCYVYYCYYDLNTKWNNLVNLVSEAKRNYKGELEWIDGKIMNTYDIRYLGYGIDIIVPKEQYSFNYRGFSGFWHLTTDKKENINQSYAFIFKIRSIVLE